MAQQPEGEITQRPIGPGRQLPPMNGGDGGDGGGGCMPGTSLLDLSLVMNPDTLFVAVGTQVQLSGSATVRHWLPDCNHQDRAAPVVFSLSYQPIGGRTSIDLTSILADHHFTVGFAGIYDIFLTCPLVAAVTSARLFAGPGAVLEGTATAWVNNPFLGCRKFDTDPSGNPIRFHAVIVTPPQGTQSTVQFDPIRLPNAVITQTSPGTGSFDLSAGTIEAQLHGAVQARFNGTVDTTLSTGGRTTACDNSSVSGSAISNHQATLVGDAPVDGPPGTTHCWLAVNANVMPVGF
jgi:hypothetical protein